MCVVWGMCHWLICSTKFLEASLYDNPSYKSNQSYIFVFPCFIDLFGFLLSEILVIWVLFDFFLLDSRHDCRRLLLSLLKPTLKNLFMCWCKAFFPEIVCRIGMLVYWYVAIKMYKVPFNWNYAILCFNVSSSWHSLALELASSSVARDVVIELAIIGYLDPQRSALDGLLTGSTTAFAGFCGLYQNLIKTHLFNYIKAHSILYFNPCSPSFLSFSTIILF